MTKILRNDLFFISNLIKKNEKVLDVGCGNGNLIEYLFKEKNVDCLGVEIELKNVNLCLEKGLSVVQGDANFDLNDYPDHSFTTAILSQTIHAMIYPDNVIENLIRIAKRAIISFPNFGYWKIRRDLFFSGLMPKNSALPFEWYNTPNIHLCSIKDFINFCDKKGIEIKEFLYLNEEGEKLGHLLNNFRAYQAIFCVSKK